MSRPRRQQRIIVFYDGKHAHRDHACEQGKRGWKRRRRGVELATVVLLAGGISPTIAPKCPACWS